MKWNIFWRERHLIRKSGGGAEQDAFDPDGAEFCISADGYSKTGGGRSYGIGACNGSSASDAGACSQTGIAGSVGIRGKCHGFTFSDVRKRVALVKQQRTGSCRSLP